MLEGFKTAQAGYLEFCKASMNLLCNEHWNFTQQKCLVKMRSSVGIGGMLARLQLYFFANYKCTQKIYIDPFCPYIMPSWAILQALVAARVTALDFTKQIWMGYTENTVCLKTRMPGQITEQSQMVQLTMAVYSSGEKTLKR